MGQAAIPLISLAVSAAGAGLEYNAASNESAKQNQAVASQLAEQQQFSDKAHKVVTPNIQKSAAPQAQQQIAQGASDQLAKFSQLQNQPVSTAASATPENRVTNTSAGAQQTQQAQAAAKLAGYGTWENAQNIANQNVGNQLGVINTESGWAAQPLPAVLAQAGASSAPEAAAGSLIGSAGSVLGNYNAVSPLLVALSSYQNNQSLKNASIGPKFNTNASGATDLPDQGAVA